MPPLQQEYFDLLVEHVRADRYPSHQLLDRIEASFWTGEQVRDYIVLLLEKLQQDHYPSHQLLDRIERMLTLTATVA
jgi:aspartyl-tRNA synthetase